MHAHRNFEAIITTARPYDSEISRPVPLPKEHDPARPGQLLLSCSRPNLPYAMDREIRFYGYAAASRLTLPPSKPG
ncbi:hypothetical protein E4U55_006853, partial [Claviceps digitariae]